jgi:hypothetical protein
VVQIVSDLDLEEVAWISITPETPCLIRNTGKRPRGRKGKEAAEQLLAVVVVHREAD